MKKASKDSYDANPEKKKEASQKYYDANTKKKREASKKAYKENTEKCKKALKTIIMSTEKYVVIKEKNMLCAHPMKVR